MPLTGRSSRHWFEQSCQVRSESTAFVVGEGLGERGESMEPSTAVHGGMAHAHLRVGKSAKARSITFERHTWTTNAVWSGNFSRCARGHHTTGDPFVRIRRPGG
ncbi:hypothetical protein LshimejAT787_0110590 [Lyophyllum shimeji]|uniref:Uncharacterized protein n=1 Tax=Lyophyllum shimeji TaxID=47721 RepID=A0A9P3PDS7_LYOSH|nr:hypothetical protein LshimejAT787_0110590 [Lyophyllum shimeji]